MSKINFYTVHLLQSGFVYVRTGVNRFKRRILTEARNDVVSLLNVFVTIYNLRKNFHSDKDVKLLLPVKSSRNIQRFKVPTLNPELPPRRNFPRASRQSM